MSITKGVAAALECRSDTAWSSGLLDENGFDILSLPLECTCVPTEVKLVVLPDFRYEQEVAVS